MEKENYLKMDQENHPCNPRDPLLVIGYIWYNINMVLSTEKQPESGGSSDAFIE
ncbi:MAG: hypothetical protein RQM95_11395 [Syntrophaceticus schinkii]